MLEIKCEYCGKEYPRAGRTLMPHFNDRGKNCQGMYKYVKKEAYQEAKKNYNRNKSFVSELKWLMHDYHVRVEIIDGTPFFVSTDEYSIYEKIRVPCTVLMELNKKGDIHAFYSEPRAHNAGPVKKLL